MSTCLVGVQYYPRLRLRRYACAGVQETKTTSVGWLHPLVTDQHGTIVRHDVV